MRNHSDLSSAENLALLRALMPGATICIFTVNISSGAVRCMDGTPLQLPNHDSDITCIRDLKRLIGDDVILKLRSLIAAANTISRRCPSDNYIPYRIITHIHQAAKSRLCWRIRIIPVRFDDSGRACILACLISPAIASEEDDQSATVICNGGRHISRLAHDRRQWTKTDSFSLSDREITVLHLTSTGSSVQEIADIIHSCESTVKNIRRKVCEKTGARNAMAAIRILQTYGIISPE